MSNVNLRKIAVLLAAAAVIGGGYWYLTKTTIRQAVPDKPEFLQLPAGFEISIFARDLKDPRVITFDPRGRLAVSETDQGKVLLLEDKNLDGVAERQTVLIENLRLPHGLAFYTRPSDKRTFIYIAETHQVNRYSYDVAKGAIVGAGENIVSLPKDGAGHFTRTIAFGPNYRSKPIIEGFKRVETSVGEKLYVSVGSSCDVCVEDSWKRAAILESDPEGTFTAEFAGGLRNAVFFTFHPKTGEIWATEMGRDNLGDNLPPDEVNVVRVAGPEQKFGARRYGWPFCYGNKIVDRTFKPAKVERSDLSSDCAQTEAPIIEIPAHSAPLGLAFITGAKWPKDWRGNLLLAYHGSWNRSVPTGYKIVRFRLDETGRVLGQRAEDFVTGWLAGGKIFGRPVDLKFGPDGSSLYVTDDKAGVIYRVTPK